jgi:hypothetical protein
MLQLPTLADRVWFAYHCLPRDERGEPPSMRSLEKSVGLHEGTLSKLLAGAKDHRRQTFAKIATALRVSEHWLDYGGNDGPVPTGIVPPRPGQAWPRHGDVPGWKESVDALVKLEPPPLPVEELRAGANLPVYRPVERITPELALAVSRYAWETSTYAEQRSYTTQEAEALKQRTQEGKHRARSVGRPAAK